jgi:hypothetical protein
MTPTTRVPGRLLTWASLAIALGASVAANIGYARPELGPRLSAATAPVLTVLAAGLLERVPLSGARRWQRWLAWLGLGAVAAAAFITSFDHQRALLLSYGNTSTAAVLLPIAVDGLIVLASVCLAVIAERRRALAADLVPAVVPVDEPVPPVTAMSDTVSDTHTAPEQRNLPARRTPKKATTADRVTAALKRTPDAKAADIARRIGVSERTVARYMPRPAVADEPEFPAVWQRDSELVDA